MVCQLRVYRINSGAMDDWLREWREHVRPLRESFGFSILGAWVGAEGKTFVWILAHEDFQTADEAYYSSPERRTLDPDPARHIAGSTTWKMRPVG